MSTAYGFFPTEILTVLDSPLTISTGCGCSVSSCGERPEERATLRETAAFTSIGSLSNGRACNAERPSGQSTDIRMPLVRAAGTANGSSVPNILIAGNPPGGLVLFHPACCNTSFTLFSNRMDSSSAETEENVYSVSLKAAKAEISPGVFVSDRGERMPHL